MLLLKKLKSKTKFRKNISKREEEKKSIKENYFTAIILIQIGHPKRFILLCPTIRNSESLNMTLLKKIHEKLMKEQKFLGNFK